MAVEVGTFSGVSIVGPTSPVTDLQGARVVTLAAVVVIGPQTGPEGTDRSDLLSLVAHLPISAITQTGVSKQGDIPVDRPDSELSTGELTVVRQLTVTWDSGPTPSQLAAFNRTPLASPIYEITHG